MPSAPPIGSLRRASPRAVPRRARCAALALLAALATLVAVGAPVCADQTDPRLDGWFQRLHDASDDAEIIGLERAIWRTWRASGDPQVDRLLAAGMKMVQRWEFPEAMAAFDAVVVRAPRFAEGWNQRASLFYVLGDYAASRRDALAALRLEPRHFGALAGLGEIAMRLGDRDAALAAFERALAIHPRLPVVRLEVAHLRALKARGLPLVPSP